MSFKPREASKAVTRGESATSATNEAARADASTASIQANPKLIYKIGSIIKLFHTFLETVNGNQFLSDCYYYYNVVTTSERKEECIQAKAVLKRMETLYETRGVLGEGPSSATFLDAPLQEIGSQRKSGERGLSPSGFITKKSTTSNFSGPLELVNGIRILKSTMGTLVSLDINKWMKN